MQWCDFYDGFWDWSDSTRKTRISSLEDMGPGEELVEAVLEIEDEKVRAQLVRKAMKLGVKLSNEDFMNLDRELDDELYAQLGCYAGFNADNPYFDEENMDWDEFYNEYSDWDDTVLSRRVKKLHDFGPSDEVCEAIQMMPTLELEEILYQKAIAAGVRFTKEEQEEMGFWAEDESMEPEAFWPNERKTRADKGIEPTLVCFGNTERKEPKMGLFGALAGLFGGGWPQDNGRCNGDCAHCPPHYGYRYGRWYYGHGHQHGCERGGNGGASGRTSRD